ncbi:unnamed protein product [Mytilus coruscus]|uniref:SUEL-type lectin domain-containing protein n=1 Tax=Mytilus coruscus TaxID=42192 RepID=A0A6J8B4J1_MYTCO|nr:unnamed protein product [Mytilus coruscus]
MGKTLTTRKICEGSEADLNCDCGRVFVTYAFYGTTPHNPCTNTGRHCGRDVTSSTRRECKNKPSCRVKALNGWYEDPCRDTVKYLLVSYNCVGGPSLPKPANCNDVVCQTSNSVMCSKCVDNELFKLVSGTCQRKCSWEDRWCWPGTCNGDLASGCTCSSGFRTDKDSTSAKCQPEIKPSIESCLTKAIAADGTEVVSNIGTSNCSEQKNFYGRNQVNHFLVDLNFKFTINVNKSARPPFVANELFGITDVDVVLETISVTGRKHLVGTTQIKNGKLSIPDPNYSAEKFEIPVQLNLTQGESLCLTYRAKGGGYLTSKNMTMTTPTVKQIPYEKTEKSRQLCYIYDREPPVFCPQSGNCPVEPVTLSKRLTTSSHITVFFRGWSDNGSSVLASGIESYAVSVYEVKEATPETLMRDNTAVAGPYNCSKDITEVDIQLPEKNPMLYAVLLEVKDKANNVGYARRFVLYDNSSYVVKNANIPFRVVSASNKTHFTWQVHHGSICYSWDNRFLNNRYKKSNPLRPIKSENSIPGVYDQISGLLPVKGTENVNGLINFYYALFRNDINVVASGKVMNFTSQSLCLKSSINDGDTFLLRLQARDIMNHTLNDSIQVHIDRSVPEIADIWLIRNGTKQLYVHHNSDLSTIYLEFKAFDLHSGIREIKWAFGIYENNTVLIEKAIAVEETNNSMYRTEETENTEKHNGNHNRRYFFTVTATNNAFLVAYDHIDILVDESPPEVGVVLEGPIGSPDIDYTNINEVTVHWHGFIDHESGIKFYRVAIGKDCINDLKDMVIGNINGSFVLETVHKSTKLVFPDGQGKYHVTVIAFNNAMSPSKIDCSDGITFDESVPEIVNVRMKHAQTVESIGCPQWRSMAHDGKFVKKTINENNAVSTFLCRTLKHYKLNYIYTPTDLFQITWNVREDHSQIAHAYVGFGKDKSSIDSPDLMDYTKTHHLESYIQHHPGLILGKKKMFVFIKVQNRAGLDQMIWFGPILADETPPVCHDIPMPVIGNGYVIAKWDKGNFYDTEQTEEIGSVMFRVGTSIGGTDVVPFTTSGLTDFVVVKNLDLQSGQVYYATVRAFDHLNRSVERQSEGVIYDNTPPSLGTTQVEGELTYVVKNHQISVQWFGIEDKESGIVQFEIGIGSTNHSADIVPFHKAETFAELNGDGRLVDGHRYYAIVKATNGAGLYSFSVSTPFLVDRTGPLKGHVMDISPANMQGETDVVSIQKGYNLLSVIDIDYQRNTTSISCKWRGFHDPHSQIESYHVGLGLTSGNDDIEPLTNIGLKNIKTWISNFVQGVRHYCILKACNGARLCSHSSSNGVLIDNSAPIPGLVVVGEPGIHSRYQSDNSSLHATWIGFKDPQSGIDHFEVCIGTRPLLCDIMNRWNVSLSSAFVKSQLELRNDVPMFVTVRACNKVKLCVERSSPSFEIDNTPPVLLTKPHIESVNVYTSDFRQIISDPSFFKILWRFEDNRSPIIRTTITISSKLDSHIPMSDTVLSNENVFTVKLVKDNHLRLGDIYAIKVTACNAALLCSTAHSVEVLLDYSPPQIGGFMPPLSWEVIPGTSNFIRFDLSWYGFSDVESKIKTYYISIGYDYSGIDIVDAYKVKPAHQDEGRMQHTTINIDTTNNLPEKLVFTIWAENYAGLSSSQSKITTDVVSFNRNFTKGNLVIQKHSCVAEYCNKDCTCAVVGQKCKSDSKSKCNIKTESNGNSSIRVRIIVQNTDIGISGSSSCLRSEWTENLNETIWRFEYTFGIQNMEPGNGIFNAVKENIWRDVGKETKAIHCLSPSSKLEHRTNYVAYVKAWYSFTLYKIFQSEPVQIDHTSPAIQKRYFVIDSISNCKEDVDYILSTDSVLSCWDGVFYDEESGIENFMVSVGTSPYADDVVRMHDVGHETRADWRGLSLEPGTRYFTTVRAINKIGLQTELSSDGFVIDDIAPIAGIVYNTGHHSDVIYQSINQTVQFSWHGFEDEHSFIDSYYVGFIVNGKSPLANDSVSFQKLDIHDHIVYDGNLNQGDTIAAMVKAIDKAGHESHIVTSLPLSIDNTPPQSFDCKHFEKIYEKHITGKYRWLEQITCHKNSVYKIKVSITDVTFDFKAFLTVDDMSMVLHFVRNSDGTLVTEYNFFSFETALKHFSLDIYGALKSTVMLISVSTCSAVYTEAQYIHTVIAQQISSDRISICVRAIDLDTGIKQVNIGIGSVNGGFELQTIKSAMSSSHRMHDIVEANLTHGFSESSCDIIGWTATSSLSESQSKDFRVQHGSRIFLQLRCINGVQLSRYAYSGPLVVSYNSPENIGSKIQFITDTGIKNVTGDQGILTFRWDYFNDLSGIESYSSRVSNNKTLVLDIQIPNKNYIRIKNLHSKNKEAYSVDVIGTNVGNISSNAKHASVRCEYTKPSLSGKGFDHGVNYMDWKEVFTSTDIVRSR